MIDRQGLIPSRQLFDAAGLKVLLRTPQLKTVFRASVRAGKRLAAIIVLLSVVGCGSDLVTQYGNHTGYYARRSINGFATFRNSFDEAGFYSRGLTRLTERTRKVTSIIWTPPEVMTVDPKTGRWLNRWLQQGGRTLVYVIPDSGNASEYYRQLRPQAAPDQRLEYRRRLGESLIEEHRAQHRRSATLVGGWFVATPRVRRSPINAGQDATEDFTWYSGSDSDHAIRHEWMIESIPTKQQSTSPTPTSSSGVTNPSGNNSAGNSVNQANVFSQQGRKRGLQFSSLAETGDGETILAQLTADDWNDSRIIVVAGGSRLTNFGLTDPGNRDLAEQLIDQCRKVAIDGAVIDPERLLSDNGDLPQVGFITASDGLPVSSRVDEIPRATGAESLTQFPLVIVTFHAAVIGIVFCLMLFPIFGRPANVDRGTLTHFGDHLDAVANLLYRRGGETFARKRISEYMRRVRGETHGPWVIDDPIEKPAPSSSTTHTTRSPETGQHTPPVAPTPPPAKTDLGHDSVTDRPESTEQPNRPEEQR